MVKISRTCDGCKELLRKADMYETLNEPRWKYLCPKCWELWINDKLEDKE